MLHSYLQDVTCCVVHLYGLGCFCQCLLASVFFLFFLLDGKVSA